MSKLKDKLIKWLGVDQQIADLEERIDKFEELQSDTMADVAKWKKMANTYAYLNNNFDKIDHFMNGWDLLGKNLALGVDLPMRMMSETMVIVVSKLRTGYGEGTVQILDRLQFRTPAQLRSFIMHVRKSFKEAPDLYWDGPRGSREHFTSE